VTRIALGLCLNYYAVTSSSDLVVHGALGLNQTELRGPLSTRRVRTGALDPFADATTQTLAANELNYRITGFPYVAPKVGRVPLPFVSPGFLSFGVRCGDLLLGRLSWTNSRPIFKSQPGSVSDSQELTLRSAVLSALATNGAFTGSMQTLRTDSVAAPTNHSFSGVLLQSGSVGYMPGVDLTQPGIGLTSDGLPITFE